jgi:hypothetical protein
LSDLFASRQAVCHHAEGAQDRLDDDGDDQQGQDGFVAMASVERCVPGRYCFPCRADRDRQKQVLLPAVENAALAPL